jgi:hypothetical protein
LSFITIRLLVQYYRRQAGRGRENIGPIYSTPPFIQRGHGLGSILAGLFRTRRPILWSGAKSVGKEAFKALGREALRTGGNIIRDIEENPPTQTTDIISKHVAASTQNIINKLRGIGCVRKRKRVSSAAVRNVKRKETTKRALTSSNTIKRDIFS